MEERGTGDERLAAICQMIRNETLDPAKEEAEHIRHAAEREAAHTRSEAKRQAEQILHDARAQVKKEREAFDASLDQASRQTISLLKQQIEQALFNPALDHYITEECASEQRTAQLLDVIIEEIQKEGLHGDLAVWLGQRLSKEAVLRHMSQEVRRQIATGKMFAGEHDYGIVVKIVDRHLSIEITPEGLKEIMSGFLRQDFRSILFKE
jgi:V/A-type H+-transporting ATPase subunit E